MKGSRRSPEVMFSKPRLPKRPGNKVQQHWCGSCCLLLQSSCSLPPVQLQHLLGERGQEVIAVDCKRADVQHGEVSWKLLEQRAAACVPHLRGKTEDTRPKGQTSGLRATATCTRRTDHGGAGGLVASTHQRPAAGGTPEDGVLGQQLAGRAGSKRLDG